MSFKLHGWAQMLSAAAQRQNETRMTADLRGLARPGLSAAREPRHICGNPHLVCYPCGAANPPELDDFHRGQSALSNPRKKLPGDIRGVAAVGIDRAIHAAHVRNGDAAGQRRERAP
jgi:hypothetical protein